MLLLYVDIELVEIFFFCGKQEFSLNLSISQFSYKIV